MDRAHRSSEAGPSSAELRLEVVPGVELAPDAVASIHALCERAYGEDLEALFATFPDPTHVIGFLGDRPVSHAMWVTRWLQAGDGPLLRTAYVEMVATEPRLQGRGLATLVMRRLTGEITGFDLGALCPAEPGFYSRLGWTFWSGPLFIRADEGRIDTPDERVMTLGLPGTPELDPDEPLSAEWREGELW